MAVRKRRRVLADTTDGKKRQLAVSLPPIPLDADTKRPFKYADSDSDDGCVNSERFSPLLPPSRHTLTTDANIDAPLALPRSSQFSLLPNRDFAESVRLSTVDLITSPFEKYKSEWSYERRSHLHYHLKNLVAVSNGVHFYRDFEILENDSVELALTIGDFVQVVFDSERIAKRRFIHDSAALEIHIGYIFGLSAHGEEYLAHCGWLTDIPTLKRHYSGCYNKYADTLKRHKAILTEDDILIATDKVSSVDVKAINCDVKVTSSIERFQSLDATSDAAYFCAWRHDSEANALRNVTSVIDTMEIFNPHKEVYESQAVVDPVKRLIRNLQLDFVPDVLSCRENETASIFDFLHHAINSGGSGQLLYICGMPGTGKTATVMKVLKRLQLEEMQTKIHQFKTAYINAMELRDPSECYRALASKLLGIELNNSLAAYRILNAYFRKEKHVTSSPENEDAVNLIVIDEADYLASGKLDVLYTIFDWPSQPNAKVVLILMCNTMDLPSRMDRCSSRLGVGYINFKPYSHQEIETIVLERLKDGQDLFDSTSIRWCARIIANFSGDIRKALHIYRRALEIKQGNQVKPIDIKTAERELCESAVSTAVELFPWGVRAFLVAVVAEYTQKSQRELPLSSIYKRFEAILNSTSSWSAPHSLTQILAPLVRMNIVSVTHHIPKDSIDDVVDWENDVSLANMAKQGKGRGRSASQRSNSKEAKRTKLKVSHEIDELRGDLAIELIVDVNEVKRALLDDTFFKKFLFD